MTAAPDVDHVAVDVSETIEENHTVNGTTTPRGIQIGDDYDKALVHRAVADAGLWAFGITVVELWVMNENKTRLFRPPRGYWLDPVRHQTMCATGFCDLCRLTNTEHPEYLPPVPLAPGVGLPGILWNESDSSNPMRGNNYKKKVVWRDVKFLSEDPDQASNPRLDGLVAAGLGWAAGIHFSNGGQEGLVIFISRKGVSKKIKDPVNEAYLVAAADLIGSAWALRGPRHDAVQARQNSLHGAVRNARIKLLVMLRLGITIEELTKPPVHVPSFEDELDETIEADKEKPPVTRAFDYAGRKAKQVGMKSLYGGMNQPPPGKSIAESMFSAVGTFLTMLIVTQLGLHFVKEWGGDYSLVVGPFGALATLHYALTAAPASQPRNAMMGQLVALTFGVAISKSGLEKWMKMSLAPAVTVLITTKFGIVHPPAGATAVIFAGSATLSWTQMGTFLLAYFIVICCSIFFNNLNDKRQYPTYWGVASLKEFIVGLLKKKDDEAMKELEG
eukprot:CAMPEP_0119005940 /NCGR_PEP_ID=MMETSP1176-20130426/2019_1 /TAXON_ID=265551 /ORGANISM="Synedropsis recta cf, Strain CCMP1620" /LENGTH=501 /DNA_ID=CAMNT_0006957803 /DNA_START=40 /DNA_END=1541 /DNA_ORIENTATION=+